MALPLEIIMSDDQLIHVTRWHNGEKTYTPFSDAEMTRRSSGMQALMAKADIDACLFTSYHNICYFSGFLYCKFGRRYGAVLNGDGVAEEFAMPAAIVALLG